MTTDFFKSLFNTKKDVNKELINKNIMNINSMIDLLNKKILFYEQTIADCRKKAVEAKKYSKYKALMYLKYTKIYDSRIINLYSQVFNLEKYKTTLETCLLNQTIINNMKQIAQDMSLIIKNTGSITEIEDIMDNISESMQISDEVSTLLSGNDVNEDISDEELLNELNKIEKEENNENEILIKKIPPKKQESEPIKLVNSNVIKKSNPININNEGENKSSIIFTNKKQQFLTLN